MAPNSVAILGVGFARAVVTAETLFPRGVRKKIVTQNSHAMYFIESADTALSGVLQNARGPAKKMLRRYGESRENGLV